MSDLPVVGASVVISSPAQQFTRTDQFQSLFYGKIYIGQIDKDPTDPKYQIDVWAEMENGTLEKVPQPLRTNAAGFPVYNGQIVKFVTTQGHSMALYDSKDVRQAYYSNVLKYDPDQFSGSVGRPDGMKVIGRCKSVDQLRSIVGTKDQWIALESYNEGTHIGGGFLFWVNNTTRRDDGGVFFRVNADGGWMRDIPDTSQLNINFFGAMPDGSTDSIPAMKRMHDWAFEEQDRIGLSRLYSMGIVLGPGKYAVSSWDLGAAEIQCFKLFGPTVFYGVSPRTTIVPMSQTTTTPVFSVYPRRMEVSNIYWAANGSTQPFIKNRCPRGSYVRVHAFVVTRNAGIVFQVADSIDTQFDQIYAYNGTASFLLGTWTNGEPGGWNHLTAIEFANCNFSAMKGPKPVIDCIRATQCIMRNVWFTDPGCAMDISQGGWMFDTLIVEGAQRPIMCKWAKVEMIHCRVEQGATWDWEASGYDASMDAPENGGAGRIPASTTNDYDQGRVEINQAGCYFKGGVHADFRYSEYTIDNAAPQGDWYYLGRICVRDLGDHVTMRFLGSTGWDNAAGAFDRPGATGFGGGETILNISAKSPNLERTGAAEAHWHNEGAGPISDFRIVHQWNNMFIYFKPRNYSRRISMMMDSTGKPRIRAGSPFYYVHAGTVVTAAEIANMQYATKIPARFSFNKGDFADNGFGQDLDTGSIILYQKNRVTKNGIEYMNFMYNGEQRYVRLYNTDNGHKMPFVSMAELRTMSPATFVACYVLVSDARGTPYGRGTSRMAWSDGYQWTWADDLSTPGIN